MDSRVIRRIPPCISLARMAVGTASSRRRIGLVDLEFVWIQKLTFPLRYPKMVPVTTVEEMKVGWE